jgi:uncharacterized protein
MRLIALLFLVATSLLSPAALWPSEASDPKAGTRSVQVIDWKHLVPPEYNPTELIRSYSREAAKLRDNDPRAQQLAEELRKAWENAPVVESLNNRLVKLAGFLVTLEGDGKTISEFLLVPFFGACIHVPPPPSNQVVLVRTAKPIKLGQMFDMVAVTGRLRTESSRNELASASYVIYATHVEPHKP